MSSIDLDSYIGTDEASKLLDLWSQSCKLNNHNEVVTHLATLKSLSQSIISSTIRNDTFHQFYTKLVDSSNIKLIYRCLNLHRNNITIPTLQLLTDLFNYNISIFINNFDLSINILPKLLSKNDSIRFHFIKFWINLNSKFGYFDRSQQFLNKVWINIFKNLNNDSIETIKLLVEFIDSKIIQEQNYKKSHKLKFLNEDCLFNLQTVLSKFDYSSLFKKITDYKTGILFIEPPNYTVNVNNQNFRINNKVLYNLLTFIKLNNVQKINLAMMILSKDANLINPYMNYLVIKGGYNDPNLSNWYFCHTLLYIRILNLNTFELPHILLKPLSKTVLVKGIQSASPLIVQLNLQIIALILKKLSNVHKSSWNKILKSLPEIPDILSIKTDNNVVSLLILKVLELYSKYQNSLNSQLNKFVDENLNFLLEDFNKLNLIKLNLFITIQLNLSYKFDLKKNNLVVKLINFNKLDDNPLFFYNLIKKLVDVPDINLLNPLYCILKLKHVPEALDNVMDQLILRLSNSVYKYYDMDFDVNVFTKIMFEQLAHAVAKDQGLLKFVKQLAQELVIIGEKEAELKKLLLHLNMDIEFSIPDCNIKIIKNDYEFLCCVHNISTAKDATEIFQRITNYIASNPNFVGQIGKVELFKYIMRCCNSSEKRSIFNNLLKSLEVNFHPDVKSYIHSMLKSNDEFIIFNWILDFQQLNDTSFSEPIQLQNYIYLLTKNEVPELSVSELFKFKSSSKYEIIKSKLNSQNISLYIKDIIASKKFELLEDIDLDNKLIEIIINSNLTNKELCEIGAIITSSNDLTPFYESFNADSSLEFTKLVKLYAKSVKYIQLSVDIPQLINMASNYTETFNSDFIKLMKHKNVRDEKWMSQSMIFITKQFAELEDLSHEFEEFLTEYVGLFPLSVPRSVLDAQLEVVLSSKYINTSFIHYISKVILAHTGINVNKALTIFVNNPMNSLNELPKNSNACYRIESALIINNLYNMGANHRILDSLIHWYNGLILFEDLIIKRILISIEEKTGKSWMTSTWNWEINEFDLSDFELVGEQKLFSKDLISLNKRFIKNSVESFQKLELPNSYKEIVEYINEKSYLFSYEFNDTIYDFEFLILLLINNNEFFNIDAESKVNMRNLIEYHIIELLVKNFDNPISKVIISHIIKNIDNDKGFKDINLFKIYLCNLFNTGVLCKVQLSVYSRFVNILSNPGHSLYELVYKYVLSHPKIGEHEIPLFSKIKSEGVRTIEWYLTDFNIESEDLPILNMNEFFEWILNLINLPNSAKLNKAILKIIFKVPEINNGSISLITRYGILSYLEQLNKTKPELNINLVEISEKLCISSTKRGLEWTNFDLFNANKRLKV